MEDVRAEGNPGNEDALEVITKQRQCDDGFTTFQLGFSPKEHREMIDRQWMLVREDRRDDTVRKWQTKMIVVAGVFTVIAALLGAVIGAIIRG